MAALWAAAAPAAPAETPAPRAQPAAREAVLGAGGGGGGGSGTTNSTSYTSNNAGGNGNAGGGSGRPGGDGVTNNNGSQGPGTDGGSGGNGGNGQGGAIYVATGGSLTILDSPISGAVVTGGTGGSNGVGQGPSSINGGPGAAGTGLGAGIFLSGVTANIGVSGGNVSYANTIGGTGNGSTAINKTGAGMLTLSGANTFTGDINIAAGTLSVAGTNNLGTATNDVAISNGATFAVTSTATFANGRSFSIAGNSAFDIAAGTTTTLQGVVSSNGNLLKTNDGTLVLSGTNTYSGSTNVNGGTLRAGSAGAFGASTAFTAAAGATLDLNGFNKTFSLLSGAGTVTGANSTISGSFTPGNGTPGTSMAIVGNLAFLSGAQYIISLNPTTSSLAKRHGYRGADRRDGQRAVCRRQLCRQAIYHPHRHRRPYRHVRRADRQYAGQRDVIAELRRQQRLSRPRSEFLPAQRPQYQPAERRQRLDQFLQRQWAAFPASTPT